MDSFVATIVGLQGGILMNLDEFRALKAQQESEKDKPEEANEEVVVNVKEEPVNNTNIVEEGKDDSTEEPKNTNDKIEINGEEFTIDELKQGYMRQSDYTKKTQEVSRRERQVEEAIKFMEKVQSNPQVAEELSTHLEMPNLDPSNSRYRDLEDRYFELLINSEVQRLTDKYGSFDVDAVLDVVREHGIEDLEVAYHVVKSREGGGQQGNNIDVKALEEKLREEILSELTARQESEADTSTIVGSGTGEQIKSNEPKLSKAELKVAKAMGLSPKDYATWRDGK